MGLGGDSMDDFLDQGAAETQDLQELILNKNPIGDEGLAIIAESRSDFADMERPRFIEFVRIKEMFHNSS